MSKGSGRRPGEGYSEGFDRIFGKEEPAKQPEPPADYHTNPAYWQEYDCPVCGTDFDVSPIPKNGATIQCPGCVWAGVANDEDTNTYIVDMQGRLWCNELPPNLTDDKLSNSAANSNNQLE